MTCTHCGATFSDGEEAAARERCPKCLRKSGLAETPPPAPSPSGEEVSPRSPLGWVLVAILALGVVFLGYVVLRMIRELFMQ